MKNGTNIKTSLHHLGYLLTFTSSLAFERISGGIIIFSFHTVILIICQIFHLFLNWVAHYSSLIITYIFFHESSSKGKMMLFLKTKNNMPLHILCTEKYRMKSFYLGSQ